MYQTTETRNGLSAEYNGSVVKTYDSESVSITPRKETGGLYVWWLIQGKYAFHNGFYDPLDAKTMSYSSGDTFFLTDSNGGFYSGGGELKSRTYTVVTGTYYTFSAESAGNGTVSTSGTKHSGGGYAFGSTVKFTATANTGYNFVKWTYGSSSSTTNPLTVISNSSSDGKTYTATFAIKTYKVTLNGNGGSSSSVTVNYGDSVNLDSYVPTRASTATNSYAFKGWYTAKTGGTRVSGTISNITSNKTYYAQWTVTGIVYEVLFYSDGVNLITNNVEAGGSISSPSASKTGHTLVGWYDSESGGSKKLDAGGTLTGVSQNWKLYARWQANAYTIAFNANGGSGSMSSLSMTYGTAKSLTSNAFSRTHYRFLGWSTNSSATSASYSNGQSVSNLSSTNGETVTMYAVWKKNVCTVSFNANGGTGSVPSSLSVDSGSSGTIGSTKPSRDGFLFVGWNTSSYGTGTNYSSGASYSAGTLTADKSVTLYAKWNSRWVSLDFDNLFSFTDWKYSSSHSPVSSDSDSRGIQDGETEFRLVYPTGQSMSTSDKIVYTTYTGSGIYTIPVTAGTEYRLSYYARGLESGKVGSFVLFLDSSGESKGSFEFNDDVTTKEISYRLHTVTAPAGSSMASIRFHSRAEGSNVVFGNIKFQPISYNRFDSVAIAPYVYAEGKTYAQLWANTTGKYSLPAPSLTGYAFDGWHVKSDKTDAKINATDTASATSKCVYSKFIPNRYTINFSDAGSRDGMTVDYDSVKEITAPTKSHYRFKGWKISGASFFPSTAKWGTSSSSVSTSATTSSVLVNGTSGSVYVKNLATASGASVTLTAQWELIKYNVTFDNSGVGHWRHAVSSSDDSDFKTTSISTGSKATFNVKAGCTYSILSTMVVKETKVAGGSSSYTSETRHPIPLKHAYGTITKQANRDDDDSSGYPQFASSCTMPDDASDSQTWGNNGTQGCYARSISPSGVSYAPGTVVISIKPGKDSGRTFIVTAQPSTALEHDSWTVNDGTIQSGFTASSSTVEIANGTNNIRLFSTGKKKRVGVSGALHSATASVVGDGASVSVTQGNASATTVGYGDSATWKCTISNSCEHEFVGWYDSGNNLVSSDNPCTRSVRSETALYAKLISKLKFTKEIDSGYSVKKVDGNVFVYDSSGNVLGSLSYDKSATVKIPIGDRFKISAVVNDEKVSYFSGWFAENESGNKGERMDFEQEHTVVMGDDAHYFAYFTAFADVFTVALYNRSAANHSFVESSVGTFEIPKDSTGSLPAGVTEITSSEYKSTYGITSDTSTNAKFYKIEGYKGVQIRAEKGGLGLLRVKAAKVGSSIENVFMKSTAESETIPAVVTGHMRYYAEWGEVNRVKVIASADTITQIDGRDNRDCGSTDMSSRASEYSKYSGYESSGRFEVGEEFTLYATPKNGYEFAGWYSDASCTDLLSTSSSYSTTVDEYTDEPIKVYAKFAKANVSLYKWEGSEFRKTLRWKSKVYELSKPANLTSVRVDALNYPVERLEIGSYSAPDDNSSPTSVVRLDSESTKISSQGMRRLPPRRPERYFQVSVDSDSEVDAILIGTSGGGIAT